MDGTERMTEALQESIEGLWEMLILYTPVIGAALLVLILGLIISPILGNIARRLVNLTRVDSFAEQAGLIEQAKNAGVTLSISGLVGGFVKWFFLIAFLIATVEILGWERLTNVLHELLFFIPNVIVAVVVLAVGLILGNLVEQFVVKKIEVSKTPIKHGQTLGKIARWAVVIFASLAALHQIGIAQDLIVILFAGIVLALALAFGLGGREKAAEILEKIDSSK